MIKVEACVGRYSGVWLWIAGCGCVAMCTKEMALALSAGRYGCEAKKETASLLDVSSLGLSRWSDLAVLFFKPIVESHSARTTWANGAHMVDDPLSRW
jgi:hypothetical protein